MGRHFWAEFAHSPHVCVGFLWGPQFPPTPQGCAHEVTLHFQVVLVWVGVGASSPEKEECPVWRGGSPWHSALPGEAPGTYDPQLESAGWKIMILRKCMQSSHSFPCLKLEVFGVFIGKFGDVVWPEICHRNSCLYQVSCGKIVLVTYAVSLEVAVSENPSMMLSEDLLGFIGFDAIVNGIVFSIFLYDTFLYIDFVSCNFTKFIY